MVQLLSGGMTPHPQQPLSVPRGPLSICGFRLEGGINQQENANEGPSTGAAQGRPGVWGEVGDRGQEAGHSSRPGRGRGSNRTRHGEGGWRRGDLSGAPEGGAFLPAHPPPPGSKARTCPAGAAPSVSVARAVQSKAIVTSAHSGDRYTTWLWHLFSGLAAHPALLCFPKTSKYVFCINFQSFHEPTEMPVFLSTWPIVLSPGCFCLGKAICSQPPSLPTR